MSFDEDLFDARHRLRLGPFAKRAYATVLADLGGFVDQNAFWLLGFFVVVECVDLYLAGAASLLARSLTASLFAAAVAVGWHRHVLVGEARSPLSALRFGPREARFWLLSVAFSAVGGVVAFGFGLAAVIVRTAFPSAGFLLVIAAAVGALGVGAFLAARLSLAFPLIAIDERKPLQRAWAASRMHAWFIFKLMFVTTVPFAAVIPLIRWTGLELAPVGGSYVRLAFSFVSDGLWVADICIGAAAISLVTRALLGHIRNVTA